MKGAAVPQPRVFTYNIDQWRADTFCISIRSRPRSTGTSTAAGVEKSVSLQQKSRASGRPTRTQERV